MKLDDVNANVRINGHAMRKLRQLAGYSVKSLAAKVECSRPYISMLETQHDRTCSPELFARICDALGIQDRSVLVRDAEDRSAA